MENFFKILDKYFYFAIIYIFFNLKKLQMIKNRNWFLEKTKKDQLATLLLFLDLAIQERSQGVKISGCKPSLYNLAAQYGKSSGVLPEDFKEIENLTIKEICEQFS
jgi:hypothetical protein